MRSCLLIFWGSIATILITRAGFYPAAMTGDEIWFAESAYNLWQHGKMARAIHQDSVGSDIADYLPPVITIAQALLFFLFGLSQRTIGLQSVIVPLLAGATVYAMVRGFRVCKIWAMLTTLAVMGGHSFLYASIYIRYEVWVVTLSLLYLATILNYSCKEAYLPWLHFIKGIILTLCGLAYYPLAPFIGCAALTVEALHPSRRVLQLAMLAGMLITALPFFLFINQNPAIFIQQILRNGTVNYTTFELIRKLLTPSFWQTNLAMLPGILVLLFAIVIGLSHWRQTDNKNRFLTIWIIWSLIPSFIFPFNPRLLALPETLSMLAMAHLTATAKSHIFVLVSRSFLVLLSVLAAAAFIIMLVTTIIQYKGRDYRLVADGLHRLLSEPGPAAIDQRAWLGMRMNDPERDLQQIFTDDAPPQALVFRSRRLDDAKDNEYFRYIVLDSYTAIRTIETTPALHAAFAKGRFRLKGEIVLPFTPLPWARKSPYNLVVYERQ